MISDFVTADQGFERGVPADRPRPWPGADRERQVVLLAEDDPNDLQIYGMTLWYNGFDVLAARTGEAAVRLAREHRPDLVLVDLLLPDLTGLEVCRQIRETGLDAPVIALTARSRDEFEEVAREAGCMEYLEKPISPLDVLHVVEDVVGRPPSPGEDDRPVPPEPVE